MQQIETLTELNRTQTQDKSSQPTKHKARLKKLHASAVRGTNNINTNPSILHKTSNINFKNEP